VSYKLLGKKGWNRFPTLSFFGERLHSLSETDLDITGSTKMRFFLVSKNVSLNEDA
jgi:hypothetical protein